MFLIEALKNANSNDKVVLKLVFKNKAKFEKKNLFINSKHELYLYLYLLSIFHL